MNKNVGLVQLKPQVFILFPKVEVDTHAIEPVPAHLLLGTKLVNTRATEADRLCSCWGYVISRINKRRCSSKPPTLPDILHWGDASHPLDD